MAKHLTDTKDLTNSEIEELFKKAKEFLDEKPRDLLNRKLIINIFFENSTRTRSSFEVAGKRLGADVISLDVATSSSTKGETLYDTASNLDAMSPDAIVVRHKNAGVPKILSKYVNASIINGGDGAYAHPTQALLDLFTLKQAFGNVKGKTVAIVGDIKNSRVANSNIELLPRFGIKLILVSPPHFLPNYPNIQTSNSLEDIIDRVDGIMSLRTQTERHKESIYGSLSDYAINYKITKKLIGNRDIKILHPGPVHRGVDICDDLLKDKRSLVLQQVKNGVAVRMAVLDMLIKN